jgi:hypothetical protein
MVPKSILTTKAELEDFEKGTVLLAAVGKEERFILAHGFGGFSP